MKSLAMMLGRWLLAGIFIYFACDKVLHWDLNSELLTNQGMEMVPVALAAAVLVEFLGALSLLLGSRTRMGAFFLAAYLIAVTFFLHDFWAQEGVEKMAQFEIFLRNCAVLGGLFYVIATGPGKLSRDYSGIRKRKKEEALYDELDEE